MSKYNGYNYTNEALTALSKEPMYELIGPKNYDNLVAWTALATHFNMPKDGHPVGKTSLDGLLNEDFHLPFPIICLEYPQGDDNHKIITLAVEAHKDDFEDTELTEEEKKSGFTVDPHVQECWEENSGAIIVYSMLGAFTDEPDRAFRWFAPPFRAIIPCSVAFRKKKKGPNAKLVYVMENAYPVMLNRIDMEDEPRRSSILEDSKDVVVSGCEVVCSFMEALMCPTVKIKTARPADETLNKRRARKGKKPLHEIKVLNIELPNVTRERVDLGGTHASPRLHIRRRHERTLASGKRVWVRQCFVGKASAGTIEKSYNVNETLWENKQ